MFIIYYSYKLLIAISLFLNVVLRWLQRYNHQYLLGDKIIETLTYTLLAENSSNGVKILLVF